ncbi:hypothetical protein F5B20DRAFT_593233 [Whalleya microplaca]|nr:hypothetical protein F5B20DRAFT_593233 [Whalleya microplaca]
MLAYLARYTTPRRPKRGQHLLDPTSQQDNPMADSKATMHQPPNPLDAIVHRQNHYFNILRGDIKEVLNELRKPRNVMGNGGWNESDPHARVAENLDNAASRSPSYSSSPHTDSRILPPRGSYEDTTRVSALNANIDELKQELIKKDAAINSIKNEAYKQLHVPDSDNLGKFNDLKNQITKLVYRTFEKKLPILRSDLSPEQQDFFGPWHHHKRDQKYLLNRLRGKIFEMIHADLLDSTLFGFSSHPQVEKSLVMLEYKLRDKVPREGLKQLVNWRIASLKCGELLQDDPDLLAQNTASKIWEFMRPLVPKDASVKVRGMQLLQRLCQNAVELNHLMGRSRDTFFIKNNFQGLAADNEELADEEVEEIGEPETVTGTIAYCLFGSLTKLTEEQPLKELVLEKVCLAVYS